MLISVLKKDVKIHRTVESFHSLVRTLLTDVAEREQFFKVSVSGSLLAFLLSQVMLQPDVCRPFCTGRRSSLWITV